jgi:hypothetical protein
MKLSNHRQPTPRLLTASAPCVVIGVLTITTLALGSCKQAKPETRSTTGPQPSATRSAPNNPPADKHPAPVTQRNTPAPRSDTPSHPGADPHVTCTATLKKLQPDYPWFENHGTSHSDGRAPLATFAVTQPQKYAGRTVSILFKYKKSPSPPPKKAVGQTFTFKIAPDFFTSKARILDNTCVRDLKQVKP